VLLRSVYDRGMSASELAQAVGVRPRTVRRRVRRLVQRVSSPAFTFIVRAEHAWPHRRRLIGHLFFLQGRTQRAVAARLGMSVHQVRREIDHIRGLMDQASSGPDGGR
jgi:DNA-binding transcriptional regulator LsrR (DeoR family)